MVRFKSAVLTLKPVGGLCKLEAYFMLYHELRYAKLAAAKAGKDY